MISPTKYSLAGGANRPASSAANPEGFLVDVCRPSWKPKKEKNPWIKNCLIPVEVPQAYEFHARRSALAAEAMRKVAPALHIDLTRDPDYVKSLEKSKIAQPDRIVIPWGCITFLYEEEDVEGDPADGGDQGWEPQWGLTMCHSSVHPVFPERIDGVKILSGRAKPDEIVFLALRYVSPDDRKPEEKVLALRCTALTRVCVLRYIHQQLVRYYSENVISKEEKSTGPSSALAHTLPWIKQRMGDVYFDRFRAQVVAKPEKTGSALNFLKALVSKKKRRFDEGDFDLDLSYITPNIIAMGFPAEGVESIYRNSMKEVVRFLSERHGKCFRIYNLCSERHYKASSFGGRFERYPHDDHEPPPLHLIAEFCRSASEFIRKSPACLSSNGDAHPLVVVHCKAGKGRTGLMCVSLLLSLQVCGTMEEATEMYSRKRLSDKAKEGELAVTIPSQQRYIRYYAKILREMDGHVPPPRAVVLKSVTFSAAPSVDLRGGCSPYATIMMRKDAHVHVPMNQNEGTWRKELWTIYDSREAGPLPHYVDSPCQIPLGNTRVLNEFKLSFYSMSKGLLTFQRGTEYLCSLWLHTAFLDMTIGRMTVKKKEIDGAVKAQSHFFDDTFCLTVEFAAAD